MKKFLAWICCVAMLVSTLAIPTFASTDVSEGVSFTKNDLYYVKDYYDSRPNTVEAWVQLPTSYAGRAGAIFSNYTSMRPILSFEIYENGAPTIVLRDADRETTHQYKFTQADVRSDGWTHVAFVIDEPLRTVRCYINGALVESKKMDRQIDDESWECLFRLGGDQRVNNEQYFKGRLKSVTVYSDIRSHAEIAADYAAVNLQSDNLMAHYDLTKIVNDEISDNVSGKYNVGRGYHWIDAADKEPVTDYAYSFAVVGDPQKVLQQDPDKYHYIFDYLIDNKDSKKIAFVFGVGDLAHDDNPTEWERIQQQIKRLDGVLPYSTPRGNHDCTENFNDYLNTDAYVSQFEGFYAPDKIENSWRTLRAGNVDYLLITLDYAPSDDMLNWASEIIASHPNHKVIITTHAYLRYNGKLSPSASFEGTGGPSESAFLTGQANDGLQMWDKLFSKYENIQLVISGHDIAADVVRKQSVGIHGNTVTQLMINPQWADNTINAGSTGTVSMLYFSADGNTVTVETYSTIRDQYHLSCNQFTLDLNAEIDASEKQPDGYETTTKALYSNDLVWKFSEHNSKWPGGFASFTPNESTGLMFKLDTSKASAGTDLAKMYLLLNTNVSLADNNVNSGWDGHYLSLTPKPAFNSSSAPETSDWYISSDGVNWTTLTSKCSDGSAIALTAERGVTYVYVPLKNGYFCTTNENVNGTGPADGDGDGAATRSYLDVLSKSGGFQINGMRITVSDGTITENMQISEFRIIQNKPVAAATTPVTLPDGSNYSAMPMYVQDHIWTYARNNKWKSFEKFTPNANTGIMFKVDTTQAPFASDDLKMYIMINTDIETVSTDPLVSGGWNVKYLSLTTKPAFKDSASCGDTSGSWYISRDGQSWSTFTSSWATGSYANIGSERGVAYVYVPFSSGFFCTTADNIVGEGSGATNSYLDVLSKTGGFNIDSMRITFSDSETGKSVRVSDFQFINDFNPDAGVNMSVTLTDSLAINLYAEIPAGAQNAQMLVDNTVIIPAQSYEATQKRFTVSGLLPQDISKLHTYKLSYTMPGDAQPTVKEGSFSILSYLSQIIETDQEDHWKTLAQAVINYGAAAQDYVGTEGIPADKVTENNVDLNALPGAGTSTNNSEKILSAELDLSNPLNIKIKVSDGTLKATVGGRTAKVVLARDGYAYISVYAHEMGCAIVLTDADSKTYTFTVNYYLASLASQNNQQLVKAIAAYGEAAYASIQLI